MSNPAPATVSSQRALTDGATKRCPQCHATLEFRSHYPILTVGVMLERTGSETGDRMRYERAWVCRNGRCDYRELLGDA
jgi:hypothetical protein